MRTAPLNPGQLSGVGTQGGGGVKISAFCQQVALPSLQVDGHQPVLFALFLDGQDLAVAVLQIAVATVTAGQRVRSFTGQGLAIQLLVGLVDEHHAAIAQAERTAAVLIDPTAHTEPWWRQANGTAVLPAPDSAGGVFGSVFVPEHALAANPQVGKINASGHRLQGAQGFSL